jgi:hypothetical protein
MSVYLFAGAFVMLWVAVIGAIAIVVSAVSLIGTNTYEGFSKRMSQTLLKFGDGLTSLYATS